MHIEARYPATEWFLGHFTVLEHNFFLSFAFVYVRGDGSHQSGRKQQLTLIWMVILCALNKTKR
jgi:hypothetical protein